MGAVQERMPALYLSHGAPPLADDAVWPGQLAAWSAGLPRPKAILMVSAHWEEAPLALGATEPAPLVYDFWGFPEHYYRVRYDAPGAPELAGKLAHPRTEHFAPLFVTLGASESAGDLDRGQNVIDGFWMGLAKRSLQFG